MLLVAATAIAVTAAPAKAGTYELAGGTLTITGGSTETISMQATASGVSFTTDQGWLDAGSPGETGLALTGSLYETLTVSASATGGDGHSLNSFRIVDETWTSVVLQFVGTGGTVEPWPAPVTVSLTNPQSSVSFVGVAPATPISFGAHALTVTAPEVSVRQEISAASSVSLTGTANPPVIRSSITVPAPGLITLNGARLRTSDSIALTAGTVQTTGPVTSVTGCLDIDVEYCSIAPGQLTINGDLITSAAWSGLARVSVTGLARLGADVTTSSAQDWQGRVYVTALGTLTLTGSSVSTPHGVMPYAGPCGGGVVVACGVESQSPPSTYSGLVIDGDWLVGGSVMPSDSITATGLTSVIGTGADTTFSPVTAGAQDYLGGLSIVQPSAAVLSGSTLTIAGMPNQAIVGAVGATTCDSGPLTVIGELHITAAVNCLDSLIVSGPATVSADVATVRFQSYQGAVTLNLGDQTRRLRAGVGQTVAFPGESVTATWTAATGDVTGYTATIAPTGQTCTTAGALLCGFGTVPDGNDLMFSVSPTRPAAASSLPQGGTTSGQRSAEYRRTVGRGSRTSLGSLIPNPSVRGTRAWSERGACSIRGAQLLAPNRRATCTLLLRVKRGSAIAWTGRATISVR